MFEVVYANEIDKNTSIAYTMNNPETKMYNKNINELTIEDFEGNDIDVIIGGPPCQAFSTVGKRLLDDPRSGLFKEYHRIVSMVKPKVFVFENVVGLLSYNNGETFSTIISLFEELGYRLYHKVLNVYDYGVAQQRKRVIIVGTMLDNDYYFPECDDIEKRTLFDCIGKYEDVVDTGIIDHNSQAIAKHLQEYVSKLPQGGDRYDVEEGLRPKSGFGNSYARLSYNEPSPTITRNFICISSARCIHPTQDRPLTIFEGKLIQSFPIDYKLFGSKTDKCKQIGNAVPPLLSIHLAKSIEEHLTGGYKCQEN